MCVYSMIMDHYQDKWTPAIPFIPNSLPYSPSLPYIPPTIAIPYITKEEIEEFRKLLERAREYDKKNNEPDCELQEKKDALKALAEKLGIKIDFI